jgi:hypothetical protein
MSDGDPGTHDVDDPTAAVIAHSLISSVAVVTHALQSLIAYGDDLDGDRRRTLLSMALTQAEYLTEVLKDMARGLPADVIDALDGIGERRPLLEG